MEEHYHLYEKSIREMISKATMAPKDKISIAKAELGNNAGIVGAASLFLKA